MKIKTRSNWRDSIAIILIVTLFFVGLNRLQDQGVEENLGGQLAVRVEGNNRQGTIREAHVHSFRVASGVHNALSVLTQPFLNFNPEFHPFLNDTFGTAMNQNVSFSGSPEFIHDGGTNTRWTGTATQGTWNFADAGEVRLTGGNNNDRADFATTSH